MKETQREQPRDNASIDGRTARRERGRQAVISAVIDLTLKGHPPPSAERVAKHAGVSVASVFRYFDTLDELRTVATQHYFTSYSHIMGIDRIGEDALDDRVARLAAARSTQYEQTEPMARIARQHATTSALQDTLSLARSTQTDQIRTHFDAELRSLGKAERDDIVATIATLTSFEAWDLYRFHHNRTPQQIRRAWERAITNLLA